MTEAPDEELERRAVVRETLVGIAALPERQRECCFEPPSRRQLRGGCADLPSQRGRGRRWPTGRGQRCEERRWRSCRYGLVRWIAAFGGREGCHHSEHRRGGGRHGRRRHRHWEGHRGRGRGGSHRRGTRRPHGAHGQGASSTHHGSAIERAVGRAKPTQQAPVTATDRPSPRPASRKAIRLDPGTANRARTATRTAVSAARQEASAGAAATRALQRAPRGSIRAAASRERATSPERGPRRRAGPVRRVRRALPSPKAARLRAPRPQATRVRPGAPEAPAARARLATDDGA